MKTLPPEPLAPPPFQSETAYYMECDDCRGECKLHGGGATSPCPHCGSSREMRLVWKLSRLLTPWGWVDGIPIWVTPFKPEYSVRVLS